MKKLVLIVMVSLFFSSLLTAQDILIGSEMNGQIADSLYRNGDYEKAVKYYNMALISSKTNPDLFYMRARTYIKLNDISKARRDLNRAARIGSYKSELLRDSLLGRTSKSETQIQFEKDLEKYFEAVGAE